MKYLFCILTALSVHFSVSAQADANSRKLRSLQDSLKNLGFKMVNQPTEPERYAASYQFIKTLIEALKTPNSFRFPFDSVKTVSIQPSGDNAFRIFSWHVQNTDGSYRYYGTIQMNRPDGKLQLFPLVDYSSFIKTPADTVTTNDNWYAAQYYKVIPVTRGVSSPYYVLLGWRGKDVKTTQKVVDVLSFKDGKAYFGKPVFDGNKPDAGKKRLIFEYARQVSMLLNYQPKEGLIIFDHLSPPDPKLEGKFESYGPDMSYDAYKFVNGRWQFVEDLPLKNAASGLDDQYIDPKKPGATSPPRF